MLHRLRHRLRAVFRRGRVEAELDEELRYHLEREIERLVDSGMSRELAAAAAARAFGNVESYKEESRDAWGTRGWEDLVADVHYAARGLRRSPSLLLTSVLTLAMGIGGSTAVFSLVDGAGAQSRRSAARTSRAIHQTPIENRCASAARASVTHTIRQPVSTR